VRRKTLALPVCALALVLPGCGADDVRQAVDPVARAASATRDAGSARILMRGTLEVMGQRIEIRGSGAFAFEDPRGHLVLQMEAPGLGGQIELEELIDDGTVYMRMPALATGWFKADLDDLAKQAGMDAGALRNMGGDPASYLRSLERAGDVRRVGPADVGGVATTRFHATVDPAALGAGALPAELRGARMPVDVYVDDAGRVRREHATLDAAGMRMDMTVDFDDFGLDVKVHPPEGARNLGDLTSP